jgi:putative nucleotidyltransferase with HDIG domain
MDPRNDGRYHRFIENMDQIPSLPAVVANLIKVVTSAETSAEDAAELIEKDPALTSKVLRLANSAFYGIPRSISSVQSAVVILGFNTLKSIVLSASVMDLFPVKASGGSFDRQRFWKHSIVCALVAKHIAQNSLNRLYIDPQSAFCAGIMHDIGKLIFELFTPKEYAAVCLRCKQSGSPLVETETGMIGLNHAEIGRILADKWALPLDLEYTIVHHHAPQEANKIIELVSLIHLADILAHKLDCGLWENEPCAQEWTDARKRLSMDDVHYERIFNSLPDEIEKFKEFFSIIGG